MRGVKITIGGGCALGEVLLYIIYGYNMIIWIIGTCTELSYVAFSSKIDCSLLWPKDIFPNIKKLKNVLIDIVVIYVYNEYQIVMTLKSAYTISITIEMLFSMVTWYILCIWPEWFCDSNNNNSN